VTARTESTRPANTARHFVPAGRELVIGSESGEATVVQATAEQGVWADVPVNAPTMVRNLRTAPTAAEMNAALATNRPFGDAPKPGALALEYLSVKASQSATGTSQACICLGDLRALIARCEAAEKEYARRGEALAGDAGTRP
jgi:hypothetical protein